MNEGVIVVVFTLRLCKSQGIWRGGFGHVHMGYKRFSQRLVGVLG